MLTAHTTAFFLTVMVCHGELARDRPSTRHLTEFYLWMSVGGVTGGLFNALLAPVLFKFAIEYPLVLMLSLTLRPPVKIFSRWFGASDANSSLQEYLLDLGYAVCLGLFGFALFRISQSISLWNGGSLELSLATWVNARGYKAGTARQTATLLNGAIVYGLPMLICFGFAGRRLRFALGIVALIVVYSLTVAMEKSMSEYYDRMPARRTTPPTFTPAAATSGCAASSATR